MRSMKREMMKKDIRLDEEVVKALAKIVYFQIVNSNATHCSSPGEKNGQENRK